MVPATIGRALPLRLLLVRPACALLEEAWSEAEELAAQLAPEVCDCLFPGKQLEILERRALRDAPVGEMERTTACRAAVLNAEVDTGVKLATVGTSGSHGKRSSNILCRDWRKHFSLTPCFCQYSPL